MKVKESNFEPGVVKESITAPKTSESQQPTKEGQFSEKEFNTWVALQMQQK